MTSKQWVVIFLSISILFLSVFAGVMYTLDPLLQYGPENRYLTYYEFDGLYSNPGIAKNYTYDSVLVGTSMIENASMADWNKALDCDIVLLSYSGGTSYNMKTILDLCFSSKNTVKTVYWELDEFQLRSSHDRPRYPLPTYLYNTDHSEDLSYLLNLDILYNFLIPDIKATQSGMHKMAIEDAASHKPYTKEMALSAYPRPSEIKPMADKNLYLEQARLNVETNIIPLLESHPDTDFVFFIVPFSMLYWDNEVRNGTFDATMNSLEYAIGELLDYENARIYFYHDKWEIVTDLNNYKDYSHYAAWVNSYLAEEIAADNGRLTKENYQQILAQMYSYVTTYDFESLFE